MPFDLARRCDRAGFAGILAAAMISATLLPPALGLVASAMRADLGISRTQVGALVAGSIVLAAIGSPAIGRASDVLGGRRSVQVVFVTGLVGFAGLALSPGYWLMFIPVAVSAVAQAGGNPATNKLITVHVPAGRRGTVTGIKQSGVQVGIFGAGVVVPTITALWGWRWGIAVLSIVPMLGLLATVRLPATPVVPGRFRGRLRDALDPTIVFLMVYGGLVGFGVAYAFLIPLYAEEALGYGVRAAGLASGLVGFTALFARIWWARFADRTGRHDQALTVIAVGGALAVGGFILAQETARWMLWPAAIATGLTSSSWNSVGMIAVMEHAGTALAGTASGAVMVGFLAGLGLAPTLLGWLVDTTGSYTAMWLTSLGALVAAAFLAGARWRRPHPVPE